MSGENVVSSCVFVQLRMESLTANKGREALMGVVQVEGRSSGTSIKGKRCG